MLSFLGSRRPGKVPTEPGEPVWAIGDVHGCADLLHALLAQIFAMASMQSPTRIIFLGDYVDRGPGSREVLDLLIELQSLERVRPSFIRGNHDFMMQEFLRKPEVGPAWVNMGAGTTLTSYGIAPPALSLSPHAWRDTQARFAEAVPERHRVFLDRLEPSVVEGEYFFTHAGVRPGKPINRQRPSDLMWIRSVFLDDKRRLGKMVVHGHTVTSDPHEDHRRIGLDTGAYASGRLTAVCIEGTRRRFLQVRRTAPGRILPFWDVTSSAVA